MPAPNSTDLSASLPASLEARFEQLEQAWQACLHGADVPCWTDYLPPPGEFCPVNFVALLVQMDIECRVKAGLDAVLEQPYFQHPRLQEAESRLDAERQLALIRWEYQQRWQHGQWVSRQAYIERFPEHAAALEQLAPQWNCPVCGVAGNVLTDEGATIAQCPHCQAERPLGEVFAISTTAGAPTPEPPVSTDTDLPVSRGPSQPTALPGGLRYQVLRFHARGNLGEVHVAQDTELGREVALKQIQARYLDGPAGSDMQARFVREAEITGRLEHPGIVPVYGLVQDAGGHPCYAMRFVEGETLHDAIQRFHDRDKQLGRNPGERRLAFRELLGRFIAVCQTVAYAHSRGIVHRDLKPANILLGKYGETLVVDWGLAKKVERRETEDAIAEPSLTPSLATGQVAQTQTGDVVGTPAFMSPEQAAGNVEHVGSPADIFALGAVLYTVLTGRPPYQGKPFEALMRARAADYASPRQLRPNVPRALEAVCRKAMAVKPGERPATAQELGKEVERWLADEPVRAYREPLWARARRWARRHRPAVAALAAAILVALLAGGAWLWRIQRQEEERRLAVSVLLDRVADMLDQARWAEAKDLLDRATDRLGEGGPEDLRLRLQGATGDLQLVARLEAVQYRRASLTGGRLVFAGMDRGYVEAFQEAGMGAVAADPAVVAAHLRASGARQAFVDALHDWAIFLDPGARLDWVLAVARLADPDSWRDRVRTAEVWADPARLARFAQEASAQLEREGQAERAQVHFLGFLAMRLHNLGGGADELLRATQRLHPGDWWINYMLGNGLNNTGRWDEAVGFYRAALAVRPDAVAAQTNLGSALYRQGKYDEAVAEFRHALTVDPKAVLARIDLGATLYAQGKYGPAEVEFRRVVAFDPKDAEAHNHLGTALKAQGKLSEAMTEYRRAIDLNSRLASAHYNLGNGLKAQGKVEPAIQAYRRAIALNPGYVLARDALEQTLMELGRLAEARDALRAWLWLLPASHPLRAATLRRLAHCEQLIKLERKLPAILKGEDKSIDPAEQFPLAELCGLKRRYASATRFAAAALASQPQLANDLQGGYRYNAACYGALAGCDQGEDARLLGNKEKAKLRAQALAWLRTDLVVWKRWLAGGKAAESRTAQQMLSHWLIDPDLAGVRDKTALAKLPEAERSEWAKLWADVAALLHTAGAKS